MNGLEQAPARRGAGTRATTGCRHSAIPARARCQCLRSSQPAACGNSAPAAATAARAVPHRGARTGPPRSCRTPPRSAPTEAGRRKRDPATAAVPPTSPTCPTAEAAADQAPSVTDSRRSQTATESSKTDLVNGAVSRAQQGGDEAAVTVEHHDRLEAVFVVVRVEQAQLLLAVHGVDH